jgi:N-acetylglutamate synthase-like GNAT family acetyltransferase
MQDIQIRPYKPSDEKQAISLWRNGLLGLTSRNSPKYFQNPIIILIIFLLVYFFKLYLSICFALAVLGWQIYKSTVESNAWVYYLNELCPDMKNNKSLVEQYMTDPREHFFVATQGNKIIGCVGIYKTENSTVAELKRMSVDPLVQKQGLGKKLCYAVEDFCKKQGYKQITLTTSSIQWEAQKLYLSVGYKLTNEEFYAHGTNLVILTYDKFL